MAKLVTETLTTGVELTLAEWEKVRALVDYLGARAPRTPDNDEYAVWTKAADVTDAVDDLQGRKARTGLDDDLNDGDCDVCKGPCNLGDPS